MTDIAKRVVARYLGDLELEELWDEATYELPQGFRHKLPRAKDDSDTSGGDLTETKTVEFTLDADRDVMFYLQVSLIRGEDADEDGKYGYRHEKVEYWMTAEPWSVEGDDVDTLKRDFAQWAKKCEEEYPAVAKKWF